MTNRENIRLCGGTFFTLLLEDRKPRAGVREHYAGEKDGLSEPEVLIGLSKVLVPDFREPLESMMTNILLEIIARYVIELLNPELKNVVERRTVFYKERYKQLLEKNK